MYELIIKGPDENLINKILFINIEGNFTPRKEILKWVNDMNINLRYDAEGYFQLLHGFDNSTYNIQRGVLHALNINGSIRKFNFIFENKEDRNLFKLTWM